MLIDVRLWRIQGRRVPFKEVSHLRVYRGQLRLVSSPNGSDRPIAAHLLSYTGVASHLLPALHEPIITLVGLDGFVLRGIERLEAADGVYGVVQEWRCDIVWRDSSHTTTNEHRVSRQPSELPA